MTLALLASPLRRLCRRTRVSGADVGYCAARLLRGARSCYGVPGTDVAIIVRACQCGCPVLTAS
eukprot:3451627-Rhodomonas_salina.2